MIDGLPNQVPCAGMPDKLVIVPITSACYRCESFLQQSVVCLSPERKSSADATWNRVYLLFKCTGKWRNSTGTESRMGRAI